MKIINYIKSQKCDISILVKDLRKNKLIFNHNENNIYVSASIIKIVVLMAIIKKIDDNIISLSDEINVNNYVEFSTISEERKATYTIEELLRWMIITSDNTATNVLIDLVGFQYINNFCIEMKLKSTILERKMMDFNAITKNNYNYTSPSDMLIIMEKLYNKEFLSDKWSDFIISILLMQRDKSMIMRYISDNINIAHKTGELDNLNHDVGIIFLDNIDYFIAVFINNCENNDYGRKTIGEISKEIYNYINNEYRSNLL